MTNEQKTVDRKGWPSGPWDNEPDKLEWRAPSSPSYPCLIVRSPTGALCGYVGVPPGHPAHGKDHGCLEDVGSHWGLTYSGACSGNVCHVPEPGESDDVWWLGFDCAHAGDYCPGLEARLGMRPGRRGPEPYVEPGPGTAFWDADRYRDVDYVRACVNDLAVSLARMA